MKEIGKNFLFGFLIGLANIIPGVSGGTFMLVLGIYERIINVVNSFSPAIVSDIVFLLKNNKIDFKDKFNNFAKKYDIYFIALILAGAIVAIFVTSGIMKYLLENYFSYTYSFFFGLITVSVIVPLKLVKKYSFVHIFPVIIGIFLTVFVSYSVNPYKKALKKSEIYKARILENNQRDGQIKNDLNYPKNISYKNIYSFFDYLYAFLCGAIAISAMVLPGISGSLVLILLGEYYEVINAIAKLHTFVLDYFLFLAVLSVGMVIGLILFAKIIDFVLKRFYNGTMFFLTGLMIGSLYSLWPFKKLYITDLYIKNNGVIEFAKNVRIYGNENIFPDIGLSFLLPVIIMLVGAVLMFLFLKQEIIASER